MVNYGMSYKAKKLYFAADFETTVFDNQERTDVWSAAIVPFYSEEVEVYGRIEDFWERVKSYKENIVIYFHNLKFDGSFLIYFLQFGCQYKLALEDGHWKKPNKMENKEMQYSISNKGVFYNLQIKLNGKIIEFRDSAKLMPMSLADIGKSFKTKHQKLDMEYKGYRYPGCPISYEEMEYIKNDVLVLREALEIMFHEGHNKLTIGSCCMSEFKKTVNVMSNKEFYWKYPELDKNILTEKYGGVTEYDYIHKSYKGAWCYVVKGCENKIYKNGLTADVNSLYPYVMHSMSGNKYPYGKPSWWHGNYIPKIAKDENHVYFVRIKTRFYLKPGKLPCIQIKGNYLYPPREWLESSDILNRRTGNYHSSYTDVDGVEKSGVELTLTFADLELIKEQYTLVDFEILDGCYFRAVAGQFDEYIDYYREIKENSSGARRTIAKLFSNNLYGKFSTTDDSSFKVAYLKEDGSLGYDIVEEHEKHVGYIPIGSLVTSYARCYTIRKAQANFYGADKRGFKYADTDSIHCDLELEELVDIPINSKVYGQFKIETNWDKAIFVRAKRYIEHVYRENLLACEPYYNITCAGMGKRPKKLLSMNFSGIYRKYKSPEEDGYKNDEEKEFLEVPRKLEDFKKGLKIPSNLKAYNIPGGILLKETLFTLS